MKCEIITCPNCKKDVVRRTDEKTGEIRIQAHNCTPPTQNCACGRPATHPSGKCNECFEIDSYIAYITRKA